MTQVRTRLLGISLRRDAANASRERGPSTRDPGAPQARTGGMKTLRYGSAALALVLAGAVAACSGSGATDDLVNTGHVSGTLTVATPSAPSSLDPAVGQPADETFSDFAYTPLIVQASNGSYTPGLAQSWSYGPDNESFSIKLRSGVKFSDGTALNAAAVKTWIQHEMKPGNGGASYLSTLKSVDVTGPLTLTLKFSSPTPDLEMVFGQILALGMIGSPKAVQAGTLTRETDGAGPYMLDTSATVPGATYTYLPNPYYWDKSAVHWSKVVVKVIASPTAALEALQSGQVQVAMDQPVTSVPVAKQSGLHYVDPLTLLLGLGILDRGGKISKPLANVKVRQALNYAINRPALAKVLGAGYATAITQMAAPGWDSYDAALAQAYPYDPAKAKQLLAAAGYPNGFTLPLVSVAAVGQDLLANALQGQLSAVGITVQPDITTNTGAYFQALSSGNYPAATLSFGRLPAAFDYADLYGPVAAFNPFKSANTQLSALDTKLNAASAGAEPAIAEQMQALLVNQAWFVPVAATPLVVLYQSDVTGVNATPQRNVVYMTEIRPAG
jgi:peptide/nickel transport system substrate-binding protein